MPSPLIYFVVYAALAFVLIGGTIGNAIIGKYADKGKFFVEAISYGLSAGYVGIVGSTFVIEAALNMERSLPAFSSLLVDGTTRVVIFATTPWVLGFAFGLGLAKRLSDWKTLRMPKLRVAP